MNANEPMENTEKKLCGLCEGLGEHKPDCARHPDAKSEFVFPPMGKADYSCHHLDKKTNVLWVGIALEPSVHDFTGAVASLRSYEHVIWEFFNEVGRQMFIRRQLAAGVKK